MFGKLKYAVINRALAWLIVLALAGSPLIAIFHHHTPITNVHNKTAFTGQFEVSKTSQKCKICDLLGDSYAHSFNLPLTARFFVAASKVFLVFKNIPTKCDAERLRFSNKGPPLA